jgi:hypothetical protein
MTLKHGLYGKKMHKHTIIRGLLALSLPVWLAAALLTIPTTDVAPQLLAPAPTGPSDLIPPPVQVIIEAESMALTHYRVEANAHASKGQLISLVDTGSDVGEAAATFAGEEDIYQVSVDYLDESDGQASIEFWINDSLAFSWTLDKDPGPPGPAPEAFQQISVGDFSLRPGDELLFRGYKQGSEEVRIDRIVLNATGQSEFCVAQDTSRVEPYQYLARLAAKPPMTNPQSLRPQYPNSCDTTPYYDTIDPGANRRTLEGWLDVNGYHADGSVKDSSKPHAAAKYINANDLYLGRDMHCIQNPNAETSLACWVTNFLHPDGRDYTGAAVGGEHVVATVTMERRTNLDNRVAYYVYAPDGRRLNAIALDSEGAKSVPDVCYACHGGSPDAAGNPTSGAFLPFDLDALIPWQAKGLTLEAQEPEFALLNLMIFQDDHSGGRIHEAITHWYKGVPTGSSQFEDLPPETWFTNPKGYEGTLEQLNQYWHEYGLYTAYASNCRLCHVVDEPGRDRFADAQGVIKAIIFEGWAKSYICGGFTFPPANPRDAVNAPLLAAGTIMPNAEVTLYRILEKNRAHGSLIWSDQDEVCGWR